MINQKVNSKIVVLWNKYFEGREDVYAPLFYDNLKTGSLLFAGVNPSFSVSGYKSVMKDTEYADLNPEKFFTWRNISSNLKHVDDCVAVDIDIRARSSGISLKPSNTQRGVNRPYVH